MDWDQANVGLDQEAFRAAQAAGDTGFHVPWVIIIVLVLAVGVMGYVMAKKKGGDDAGGDSSGGDKK